MKRTRLERVRRAAERYERSWVKPHDKLTMDELRFRIRYAFTQGADHEHRYKDVKS